MFRKILSVCSSPRPWARLITPGARQLFHSDSRNKQQTVIKPGIHNDISEKDFSIKKAVLLRKVTRFEYERRLHPEMGDEALKELLISRGTNYDALVMRHDEYQHQLEHIQEVLTKYGIEYDMVIRVDYVDSLVEWADAIFTAGGDGTFLMAASKVKGHSKPVIGINTDPVRSEGHLCLPKQYASTENLESAFVQLLEGRFQWWWRQRIRLTMSGKWVSATPVDLQRQQLQFPEYRFWEHVKEHELCHNRVEQVEDKAPELLPILALNEVFIGESLSARVSYYELSIDGKETHRQKSSGITACTGTGSSSWYFNTNHLLTEDLEDILKIVEELEPGCGGLLNNQEKQQQVVDKFNSSLTFHPGDLRMAFTVREPMAKGLFYAPHHRGFCQTMSVKSRMWDGWVVVDGGLSFNFNDGAVVDLEVRPEDALRCVQFLDSDQALKQ